MRGKQGRRRAQSSAQTRSGPSARGGFADLESVRRFDTSSVARPIDPRQRRLDEVALAKRYDVGRVIAEGGMGEVRLAEDKYIGREVALKMMLPEAQQDPSLRLRFEREARIQGQLEHPSVVPVYDLGTGRDGSVCFSMKRVRGLTLEQIIEQLRQGDPAVAETYSTHRLLLAFSTACLAIEYAHQHNVVHRDLKPSNIILGQFGEVYVLDWGVAKVLGPTADPFLVTGESDDEEDGTEADEADGHVATAAGTLLGTPGYMSPEQVSAALETIDTRSDVYALGAVLFELLTLEPLHQGDDLERLFLSTLKGADVRAKCG